MAQYLYQYTADVITHSFRTQLILVVLRGLNRRGGGESL